MELGGFVGELLEGFDAGLAFELFLVVGECKGCDLGSATGGEAELSAVGVVVILDFLVCWLGDIGFFKGWDFYDDNICFLVKLEGWGDVSWGDGDGGGDDGAEALESEGVADELLEVALGEAAGSELVLEEGEVAVAVEGAIGLEGGEGADGLEEELVGGLEPKGVGLMAEDEVVEDEFVDGIVGGRGGEGEGGEEVVELEEGGKLVEADDAVNLGLVDGAAVDLGDARGTELAEVGIVVKPSESEDGDDGDEEKKPALVATEEVDHTDGSVIQCCVVGENWLIKEGDEGKEIPRRSNDFGHEGRFCFVGHGDVGMGAGCGIVEGWDEAGGKGPGFVGWGGAAGNGCCWAGEDSGNGASRGCEGSADGRAGGVGEGK